MDPFQKDLLQKTLDLAKENNEMLKSMRSARRWAAFTHFIYWVIILGGGVAGYYFLQPYLKVAQNLYGEAQTQLQNIQSVTSKIPGFGTSTKK